MSHSGEHSMGFLDDFTNSQSETPSIHESPDEKDFTPRSGTLRNDYGTLSWPSRVLLIFKYLLAILINGIFALGLALVPSFIRCSYASTTKPKLHSTAYLDGLRGVAAFFVFIHHFAIDWYPSLSEGYGSGRDEEKAAKNNMLIQLPIARIIYSGRGMVSVFFIISGFALSYKALRIMRSADYNAVLDTLSSSVFRRSMRLYLPTIVSTFISMLLCRLGLYILDPLRQNVLPNRQGGGWSAQWQHYLHHVYRLTNPFQSVDGRNIYSPPYDGHLWTIPIEFYGSIVVFVMCLMLAKVRDWLRLPFLVAVVCYTLYFGLWHLFLFLSGTMFAELGFVLSSQQNYFAGILPSSIYTSISSCISFGKARESKLMKAICISTFILALHILCFPDIDADTSPGYITIFTYTPELYITLEIIQRYWLAIGAFLLIFAIQLYPTLQHPFTTPFAQYLGKISYSLYLVHGPILYTLGMTILYTRQHELPAEPLPDGETTPVEQEVRYMWDTGSTYATWFWIAAVVNTVACVWAADVFWRVVDKRSVKIAKWIQEWCWVRE